MKRNPLSVKKCRECGCESLTWHFSVVNDSPFQNGLLKTGDMSGKFFLGCDDCSETLAIISADEIAELMNAPEVLAAMAREGK